MKKKRCGIFGKTLAFIVLILSLICIPVGTLGTYFMAKEGLYIVTDPIKIRDKYLDEYFYDLGQGLLYRTVRYGVENAEKTLENTCIYYYVTTPEGRIIGNYRMEKEIECSREYTYTPDVKSAFQFDGMENYKIRMIVPVQKLYPDYVALLCFTTKHANWLMVALPLMALGGLICSIGSLVYLIYAAGWNKKEGKQTSGLFGAIHTDIFLLGCALLIAGCVRLLGGTVNIFSLIRNLGLLFVITSVIIAGLTSLAARIKAKSLWKHSVLGIVSGWLVRLGKGIMNNYWKLPMFWVVVLIMIGLTGIELMIFYVTRREVPYIYRISVSMAIVLIMEKVIEIVLLQWLMLRLRELQIAGEKLAEGNLNYKVDTSKLFGGLKAHGENLNNISDGVQIAVNERMKSEHFKTELITNVSHDIKTPLTSIINYSDLICKEETDNEKIKEYSEVLYRQSGRLKKLIEDLVDASKASTGNIEVNMECCDVGVLLTQAAGEFEQRLFEKNIDLISKQPENPVQIMADPKLLWRVFDNLMTNICKYGQNGTRVYLSVETEGQNVVISFKNISAYPLDIDADELMERFVRGDRSRNTDGNGLGLNIAKSLTELQKGTLQLVVDGDLFKVLLSFPKNI